MIDTLLTNRELDEIAARRRAVIDTIEGGEGGVTRAQVVQLAYDVHTLLTDVYALQFRVAAATLALRGDTSGGHHG
jgi:hypothetical protein